MLKQHQSFPAVENSRPPDWSSFFPLYPLWVWLFLDAIVHNPNAAPSRWAASKRKYVYAVPNVNKYPNSGEKTGR